MTISSAPTRAARRLVSAALLGAGIMLSGCATGPQLAPDAAALQRGRRAIQSGVEAAAKKSEAVDAFVARARHNPAQCDAPSDEIYIHGRWTRVYFDGDDKTLAEFKRRQVNAAERGRLEALRVRGALSAKTRASERGLVYPVFNLSALE